MLRLSGAAHSPSKGDETITQRITASNDVITNRSAFAAIVAISKRIRKRKKASQTSYRFGLAAFL